MSKRFGMAIIPINNIQSEPDIMPSVMFSSTAQPTNASGVKQRKAAMQNGNVAPPPIVFTPAIDIALDTYMLLEATPNVKLSKAIQDIDGIAKRITSTSASGVFSNIAWMTVRSNTFEEYRATRVLSVSPSSAANRPST